ncbi:hypothetical protein GCM10010507_39850 [Streptomyces cinnamoneus]|uniref:Uncharacterized protein n=1 Tax=Streptomyces cinnamoneus TaxID=53446 RepID=A0A918TQQ5_STRCJ|nr:hypothetical protein GCM10010507_39850 [Streptomyces cinnamoneus]
MPEQPGRQPPAAPAPVRGSGLGRRPTAPARGPGPEARPPAYGSGHSGAPGSWDAPAPGPRETSGPRGT